MVNCEQTVIISNVKIAPDIYQMELEAPEIAELYRPGQFVSLYTGDKSMLLPRPISICRADKSRGAVSLVYRVAGKGTAVFSRLSAGGKIRVMGPLGNGFPLTGGGTALVGGGIGIPPLLGLAGNDSVIYLGYRDSEAFLLDEFKKVCKNINIATDDGSIGFHGNVLEMLRSSGAFPEGNVYACGPSPMLRGLAEYAGDEADRLFLSLEERMGCGTGVCLGCAVKVKDGENYVYKRVCRDGPVFSASDLIF
jgi:dihydroorotate dehydrogenase electron transfer subunit